MKKLVVLVLATTIMLLPACAPPSEAALPEFLSAPHAFTADFTMEGLAGRFAFTRYGPEDMVLEFSAPETLVGLIINIQANEFVLNYRGISYNNLLNNLAPAHPAAALYALLSGDNKPAKSTAGQTPGHTVFVYENGTEITVSDTALVSIEAPVYGLKFMIIEFRPLAEN